MSMWGVYAVGAAFFAALTAVLQTRRRKCGFNLATAIRTGFSSWC